MARKSGAESIGTRVDLRDALRKVCCPAELDHESQRASFTCVGVNRV